MKILLSAAISLDGFLDHDGPERLVLSSPEDLSLIDELRAAQDAILVGAGTVRRDNPSLRVKATVLVEQRKAYNKPEQPAKVIISKSLNLSPDARLFGSSGAVYVIHPGGTPAVPLPSAQLLAVSEMNPAAWVRALKGAGISALMVEGGAQILNAFLESGCFDRFRIALAPVVLGEHGRARLISEESALRDTRIKLVKRERAGDTNVLWFVPSGRQ